MTGQRPGLGWWQGPDGNWHPPEDRLRRRRQRQENAHAGKGSKDNSSYVESMKTLQELLKTIRAFITVKKAVAGAGITIIIVVAIGVTHNPPGQTSYPASAQQSWMSSCETRFNNTEAICSCELTYFEQHASFAQFEQDYGDMPPGVVPPELSNAESCMG